MKTFFRLLGSELERFFARRMARTLLVIAIGIGVLVGTITFLVTDKHSAPDQNEFERCLEMTSNYEGDWEGTCRMGDDRFQIIWLLGESTEDWSETRPAPEPNRTEPFRGLEGILPAIGGILAILTGGLIGASFFGAEYRFGTIEQAVSYTDLTLPTKA